MRHWNAWQHSLSSQQTSLLWDVLIIDHTDHPHPWYVDGLTRWSKGLPFGKGHRVRLVRFGGDADGRLFISAEAARSYAYGEAWSRFARWSSYDSLWMLDISYHAGAHELQNMYDAHRPWAPGSQRHAFASTLIDGKLVRALPWRYSAGDPGVAMLREAVRSGLCDRVGI